MMSVRVCRTIKSTVAGQRGERGQGFMELAISLLFLLILLSAVIDLGWAFYTLIALRDAAQEAAAYGAMCPVTNASPPEANTELIRQRLLLSVTDPIDLRDLDPNDISITFTDKDSNPVTTPVMGGFVVVSATVQHQIKTPFVGAFIGRQTYPLKVEIADTVMRSKWLQQCDY